MEKEKKKRIIIKFSTENTNKTYVKGKKIGYKAIWLAVGQSFFLIKADVHVFF